MTVPAQRPPEDVGDGWAEGVRHLQAELAACRRDCDRLQRQLDALRGACLVAHAVLDPDAQIPTPAEQHSALATLNASLTRR